MTPQAPGRKKRSRGLAATDLGFRLGTGLFATMLVVIVIAIGFELSRQSMLTIEKFGLNFWRTEVWDPVAGQFGGCPSRQCLPDCLRAEKLPAQSLLSKRLRQVMNNLTAFAPILIG